MGEGLGGLGAGLGAKRGGCPMEVWGSWLVTFSLCLG